MSLSHVVAVRVDRALHGISGSSLILELQNGQEVRIDVQLDAYRAEQVAGRIRVLLGSALRARPGDTEGVVVTSPFPPSRTPPARAGLLMMATFPPFAIAMAGAPNGPFADVATMTTMFYALWLMMRRPPTMARRLARFLFIGSVAFAADTVRTAQLARLAGTLTCLALAVWFLTITKPGETSPTR